MAESKKEYEKNEMNMISKDGMIKKISKNLNPDECDAQSLQISLFSKRGSQILFDVAPKKIETGGKFPADAFDEIIEQDVMYKVERNKGFWFEIDDHDDLECARKELS